MAEASFRREQIRKQVVDNLKKSFPFEGKRYNVELEDVAVTPASYNPNDHKKAILQARTMSEPVRGTLVLKDKAGKVLQKVPKFNLLQLPYFTDQGTFVIGGATYSVSNQLRMKPGVYTRKRKNEELEAGFNLSKGDNFRLSMDPEKGHFKMEYGTSRIPLYPVLSKLGVSDVEMAKYWNKDLVQTNKDAFAKNADGHINKLYERLVPRFARAPEDDKAASVQRAFDNTAMDPKINQRTLGQPWDKVSTSSLLAASGKLLKAYQDKVDFDERDSLAFKRLLTVDDFIGERINLEARGVKRKVLGRLESGGVPNLEQAVHKSPFTKTVHRFLSTSQLSNNPDQINPVEMLDAAMRVTSMGEGGIENVRAVPQEARRLHTSHAGILDPVRTPENERVGIDLRTSLHAAKDSAGDLYTPLLRTKTNKVEYVPVTEIVDKTIAFSGEPYKGNVDVIRNNQVMSVPAGEVDFRIPYHQLMYSPATTLVPFFNNIDGNRGTMGSKFQTQALPLVDSEPPLIQAASYVPGKSMEEIIASFIVPKSPINGTVTSVRNGVISIKPSKPGQKTGADDSTKITFHQNFPLSAKTYLNHKLTVKPGDVVKEDQLLANDSFVRDGQLTLGKNLLTAYIPLRGMNSNDAVVVSEGAAKKLTSKHMYKQGLDVERDMKTGTGVHKTYFGNAFDSKQYSALDDTGVAKPGQTVNKGDLLVAAVQKTTLTPESAMLGKLHKSLVKPYRDRSVVWEHDAPGVITDVFKTGGKIRMTVKTREPLRIGDKLCFAEATEVLTADGWKNVADVTLEDVCYTRAADGVIELHEPTELHHYPVAGEMYELESQQVDLRVTPNHRLLVEGRDETGFTLKPACEVIGKRVRHVKNAEWQGGSPKNAHTALESIVGNFDNNGTLIYETVSRMDVDEIQVLALHAGFSADAIALGDKFHVYVNTEQTEEQLVNVWDSQSERIIRSDEPVYGITVPNHTLYVRVNGKPVWTGNSNRYGAKGVVSSIIPDDQMLKDENGDTVDIALTPAGIVSRVNPAQILETALAKVAKKTGQRIMVDNYVKRDNVQYVKDELKKHGIKDKETLFDPVTGKYIPNVFVGPQYTMKLFKSTETNFSARGVEDYDVNQQPAGHGHNSAKTLGSMEVNALLAHGAPNILRESASLKSQRNDEFWRAFQLGLPLPEPKTSFSYDKFGAMLAGSGVKINKSGNNIHLTPLTDKSVVEMAPKTISNALLVRAKDLKAEKGGLFDPAATGGTTGEKWARIDLTEPIVNPVFEKPVQALLGITKAGLEKSIREDGGRDIKKRLNAVDLVAREKELMESVKKSNGAARDKQIKELKYLKGLQKADMKPGDAYVLSKIPVIPPVFRPVLPGRRGDLQVSDANYLYRDLMIADDGLKSAKGMTATEKSDARAHLYASTKALFGLGDPVSPQAQGRDVKGFMNMLSGTGRSPKLGFFQSKLLRKRQDVSGRGTIVPDATMGMDEVGLPEEMAWDMYKPFVVRRMVQRGYGAVDARTKIEDRNPVARDFLNEEIKERPVLLNRAPSLRRYNVLAAYPKLVPGKSLRIHELLAPIQAGDFDGDTMQVHVPTMPDAVDEAKNLTLSKMLLGDQYKRQTNVTPQHEAVEALHMASAAKASGKTQKFKNKADMMAAYYKGDITLNTPVEISG